MSNHYWWLFVLQYKLCWCFVYLNRFSLLTLSSQQQVSILSYTPASHLHQGLLQIQVLHSHNCTHITLTAKYNHRVILFFLADLLAGWHDTFKHRSRFFLNSSGGCWETAPHCRWVHSCSSDLVPKINLVASASFQTERLAILTAVEPDQLSLVHHWHRCLFEYIFWTALEFFAHYAAKGS